MATETMTPELEAINKVADQVKEFKTQLGDRVNKEEFKKVESEIETLKKNLGTWSDNTVEGAMKSINDANEKIQKQLTEMAEDIQANKDKGKGAVKRQLFDPSEVKKFVETIFQDGKKSSHQASFNLNTGMIIKTAEDMGYPDFFAGAENTDATAFTGRFIDPTLYQRTRKQNLIIDNFMIESIGVPTLVYLEKIEIAGDDASQEDVGGADWIASGVIKPKRSFRVSSTKVEAKKIAIFGTVHDELLQDVPSLENWIREDFTDEMREEYNDGVLNNNPGVDPDAPLGLKQNAIQFTATTAFATSISGVNYIDMVIAAVAYMRSLKEAPALAFVSSDVFYAMLILKDADNRYLNNNSVYVNALGDLYVGGIRVMPADDEDVPATHLLLVAAPVGFKIKNYGPMVFERGLNGEDFRYDRTSFRAYQRVLTYIPAHKYNTVLYDTWANIEAGIAVGS